MRIKPVIASVLPCLIGGALGLGLAAIVDFSVLTRHRLWSWPVAGIVIGALVRPAFQYALQRRGRFRVRAVQMNIPGIGSLDVDVTDAHRAVAWNLFTELTSRIATQSLGRAQGNLSEALESLHGLFTTVRDELKRMPPSPQVQAPRYTVETFALRMLNEGLRPMLARWRPLFTAWQQLGRAEQEWPLADACRNDLEVTRVKVFSYAWGLGQLLGIHGLARLMGQSLQDVEAGALRVWTDEEVIKKQQAVVDRMPVESQTSCGWRIYVELSSRVATQPLTQEGGDLSEAMMSLYDLFEIARGELKALPFPRVSEDPADETIECLVLSILNEDLRPLLTRWHPSFARWRDRQDGNAWPDAEDFRSALETARTAITAKTARLGCLIGLKDPIGLVATGSE